VAGADVASVQVGLQRPDEVGDRSPVGLSLAHAVTSGVTALVRCTSGNTSGVNASDIRITAIRGGALTNRQIGGAVTTVGSGIPVIVSAHKDNHSDIKGGEFAKVLSFPLPSGTWAFLVTAWVKNWTAAEAQVQCRVSAGSSVDTAHLILDQGTGEYDGFELALVHTFASTGNVLLECEALGASTGQAQISFVKITAIRAGTLSTVGL
jgi:hypothetical protein